MPAFDLESRMKPFADGRLLVRPDTLANGNPSQQNEIGDLMGRWFALHFLLFTRKVLLEYAGVVAPSPACRRALQTVVSLLEQDGHEVTAMSVFPT
jgi:hypothetical protein